jgi:hypothetical protein
VSTGARETHAIDDSLHRDLEDLRSKLNIIESEIDTGEPFQEAIKSIEEAVSSVRGTIWDLLSARHADDYPAFLSKIRVRRATEMCEDILADLHAGTIPSTTPGFQVFHATLQELSAMCREKTKAAGHA